jgi:hypothetical protein
VTYRTFSAFNSGGCYFYHVEVADTAGLDFAIGRQAVRDVFATALAGFLRYDIRDEGDRRERR